MTGLRSALALLTRVPVGGRAPAAGLGAALPWYGVVGALVGLVVAGSYGAASALLPPAVAALLAVAAGVMLTGALHEDGLADVADAFGAPDHQGALRALKDSRLGTYGVVALILLLGLRVTLLASLGMGAALAVVPAAAALSRGAVAVLLAGVSPAGTGLGAAVAAQVTRGRLIAAGAIASAIAVALLGVWSLAAIMLAAAGAGAVAWMASRRLGAVTGDVLGAAQQVAEVLVLLGAVAVLAVVPNVR
ncbi:MAG TPA: adenosylcobinamide-GDP ribazoletransferase [Micromonosporaceae bacterium]|nr:adenosylcobinamide-GDP ribazoletransferase [Micromonosporaceae bacterium]